MKKGILLAILIAMFANIGHAQQNDRPRIVYEINESNGRQPWWDILGVADARYKTLVSSISYPKTNTGEIVELHRLDCVDPGNTKCRLSAVDRTPSPIIFNGFTISSTIIEDLTDEMLDEIDGILYRTGQSTGSVSRKLSIRQNDNLLVILLTARWTNGNSNCDADITVEMRDITQFVDLYFCNFAN